MNYKREVARLISLEGMTAEEIESLIEIPSDATMGDYSLPCFKLSKALKRPPASIAAALKDTLKPSPIVESAEAVSGYLNFKLSREPFAKRSLETFADKGEVFASIGYGGGTVCIDYSSVNIAKPFHIGHLLTTAIGGSLYRIYQYLGYRVVGINHLGDWGTQFGKLITAYKKWGSAADIDKRGIDALLEYYIKFHTEAEKDDSLNAEGRAWFKKIESGDAEALSIFKKFKEVTLEEVSKVYKLLGIEFDSYYGESFYNDLLPGVVKELEEKGLISVSDGAKVVNLDAYDMPPCLIVKSDGASLYATRDLAAAKFRKETYGFEKCLYVVAYQQNLHFRQVFKVLELMGYGWAEDCVHVPFGMVSLENGGSLSTRSGNVVFLKDVLSNSIQRAKEIIDEKNPDIEGKDGIARDVGLGAIMFMALGTSRIKDLVFSYDKALSFDGETAPYLQYTNARCNSVLSKAERGRGKFRSELLTDDLSYAVVKLLADYDETVITAAKKYEPSIISRYLLDLAKSYNKFYLENRIITEDQDLSETRLVLTQCVGRALKNGLRLLLINAPEKM